jgi:hypothetical protein
VVVEYVSSIVATLLLVVLSSSGAFDFSVEAKIEMQQVFAVSFFQLAPEIILDFYCTFIENYGGLSRLHKKYWTIRAEEKGAMWSDGENSYSNFQKGNILKILITVFGTLVVLLASLR